MGEASSKSRLVSSQADARKHLAAPSAFPHPLTLTAAPDRRPATPAASGQRERDRAAAEPLYFWPARGATLEMKR